MNKKLRQLPSIDHLVKSDHFKKLRENYSRERVLYTLRQFTEICRGKIMKGNSVPLSEEEIALEVEKMLAVEDSPSIGPVINATGTVLHSNLGRALIPEEAAHAAMEAALHPVALEYDLGKGKRGERDSHIEGLICRLTGAEAATVVNNNAAAVLIVLNSLARGKEVIVSRGELVEIGGSFRIPEIMKASGCKMVEVGTTNRTRRADYKEAVSGKTRVLLKVHTSNYRIEGFTENASIEELSGLAEEHSCTVVEDLGSGALIDLTSFGLPAEPVVSASIAAGADIVTFSGDKLLGGPQAGIIAGKKDIIKKINKNPLKRALRVDKMTMAALETLFRIYLDEDTLPERLPALRYLTRNMEEINGIALEAAKGLSLFFGEEATVKVEEGVSLVGSGSMPSAGIPTRIVTVRHKKKSPNRIASYFRSLNTPVIGRVQEDKFILDMRCVDSVTNIIPGCE